jgi:hypothetical protein
MRVKTLHIVILLLLLAALSAGDEGGPVIERVDDGIPSYDNTSIALGQGGDVFIAAVKGHEVMLYTCRPGHVAEPRRLAPLGVHPAVATDGLGHVHAVYLDPQQKTLIYTTDESGSWMNTTIDTNLADVAPALTIDGLGKPHVAYVSDDAQKTLRHGVATGDDWKTEPVETLDWASGNVSLAVDVRGKVHVVYYNGGEKLLKYATNCEGAWKSVAVVSPLATYGPVSSLAVDTRGSVHIAFVVTEPTSNHHLLLYATNVAGPWTFQQPDAVSQVQRFVSVAVDLQFHAHFAYFDEATQQLRYAANITGEWKTAAVDKIHGMGLWNSAALDSAGRVHVSYLGESSLWHAAFPQGYCATQ